MLLTFAEVHFVLTRSEPTAVPVLDLLALGSNDPEAVSAAGLASLLVRELARPSGDDAVEFVEELAAIAGALHGADCVHQLAVTSTSGAQAWHVLSGPSARLALSPLGLGLLGAVLLEATEAIDVQLAGLVSAALDDDPDADVAVQRVTATSDTVGALTAAELAAASDRSASIAQLVAGLAS